MCLTSWTRWKIEKKVKYFRSRFYVSATRVTIQCCIFVMIVCRLSRLSWLSWCFHEAGTKRRKQSLRWRRGIQNLVWLNTNKLKGTSDHNTSTFMWWSQKIHEIKLLKCEAARAENSQNNTRTKSLETWSKTSGKNKKLWKASAAECDVPTGRKCDWPMEEEQSGCFSKGGVVTEETGVSLWNLV